VSESTTSPKSADIEALARAIRFALVLTVIGLSWLNIRAAWSIGAFRLLFLDMIGEKPFPPLTVFVMQFHLPLLWLSFLLPGCAVATAFVKISPRQFYALGAVGLVTGLEAALLYDALFAPIKLLITSMAGNPAQ
jgi:hypothetical protein